jgi:non-lysosomal glucosylceramidase
LPPLFDEDRIKCTLQKIFDYNVMRVKGGRMGAVNGMHPNGKVDETCMQSREIWTGVTYSLAATMLLHGMEHQAFTTAEGIYIAGWSEEGYGYAPCFVSLYRSSIPSIIFPVHGIIVM